MTQPLAHSPYRDWLLPAIMVSLCLLGALWPGDVSFIQDEPWLIGQALDANARHQLATVGLRGSLALYYGPFPLWLYQLLLLVSHDLRVVVVLRVLAVRGAIAWGLWSLGKTLKIDRRFMPLALLSPYLLIYSRGLWDNTFCLPLGIAALGAYAGVLQRPTGGRLATTLVCLAGLVLTHFMSLALVLPMGVHLLVFCRHALRRHWLAAAVPIALAILLPYQYWLYVAGVLNAGSASTTASPARWCFPLLGARLLTGVQLTYFFGDAWAGLQTSPILVIAQVLTLIAYPLFWIGIGRAICLARRLRSGSSLSAHLSAIAIAALAAQTLLHGIGRLSGHPHYYNGIWAIDVLLTWFGADLLARHVLGRAAIIAYGTGMSLMLAAVMLHIHTDAGARGAGYVPTLSTQLEIVRQLSACDPRSPIQSTVDFFRQYPGGIDLLTQMTPRQSAPRPLCYILMRYASDDPEDAHIEVIPQPQKP